MTLEKNGYRIGDLVRVHHMGDRTFRVAGFMPESYQEQGLQVPAYYTFYPDEYLCLQNMTNSEGHNMEGLDGGSLHGWWFDPDKISEIILRVPRIAWKDDSDIQNAFDAII